jgi:hypothetical protein
MEITIFVDHDLEGFDVYLAAGFKETGWDQLIRLEFKRLRDYGLPDDYPDQEIWRFVQRHRLLLVTNNRNNDGETSLSVTIERENTPDALPVATVSDKEALRQADYRQRVAHTLAQIILYPELYCGTGRLFVP